MRFRSRASTLDWESCRQRRQPDRLLTSESEIIELDSIRLTSLYTPGHAPGHLSFYLAEHKILFSGDTLFAGSIGRTDLPGGDHQLLMEVHRRAADDAGR